MIDLSSGRLFRRHVMGGTEDGASAGELVLASRHLGDAEVQDLDEVIPFLRRNKNDVVRLQIAVNDVCVMRRPQCFGQLVSDVESAMNG